ncbi:MAG TPA: 6-bladed beta-propeller [Bacteroidales bacterium]|nr:6-bladed beta-propeller [Bacteroidales bacterium]
MRLSHLFFLVCVGVILICASCNDDSGREKGSGSYAVEENKYYIDIKQTDDICFYDLFSKVEIIPFETSPNSIISSIKKVHFANNKYFVLDQKQKSVLIFSENGSLINRIREVGRGPGEYTLLDDFVVNPFTGELELLNPRGDILVVDDLGREIDDIKLPSDFRSAHFIANLTRDTTILFSLFEKKQILFFDRRSGEIFHEEYEIDDVVRGTPIISCQHSPFYFYENKLFFFDPVNSIIYKVTKDKLFSVISFDFGKHQLKYDNWPEDRPLHYYVNILKGSNYAHAFRNFVRNDSLIIFRCIYDRVWHTVLLNYNTGNIRVIKKFRENTVFPGIFDLFDRGIYAIVEPKHIQLIVKEEYLDEKNKDIFNSVSLEDNPVIIKYYWK